jgi:hypothetical protein
MVKFEFKRNTLTNQDALPTYRPTAPVTGGNDPTDFNTDDTTHPERPLPVQDTPTTSSTLPAGTAQQVAATDPGAGGSGARCNQPYTMLTNSNLLATS